MTHDFANEIIKIDIWRHDDRYDNVYPQGAREKAAFFSPKKCNYKYIKPNWRYLFKLSRSEDWCPWQFWMEIIAYRFGSIINVNVPPAWPAMSETYNPREKTYGSLIEWFYDENEFLYYDGGDIMYGIIENFDRKNGTNHNWISLFEYICDFYKRFYNNKFDLGHWAKVLTFDTLIGNTDCHQDNWGIILNYKEEAVLFSPAFDNGTALCYEISERKIRKLNENDEMINHYINRGHHHMKWSIENDFQDNFFSFMKKFVNQNPETKYIIQQCLNFEIEEVEDAIYPLCGLINNDSHKLSNERVKLIIKLITKRKGLLEKTLDL